MDDELFQEDEAAARLHRPPATLQWWRHKGRGPKYLKIGRRIYYRRSHLEEFLEAAEVTPEATARDTDRAA